MAAHAWHYIATSFIGTDETKGPISEAELTQLAKAGQLKRDTLVSSATRTAAKWHRVDQIPALLKILEAGEAERAAAKAKQAADKAAEQAAAKQARGDERRATAEREAAELREFSKLSHHADAALVQSICERVRGILTENEAVAYVAIQQKPVLNLSPDAILATNRRLIFYRPKMLGRYEFQDYLWLDLRDAHVQQNMLGCTFTAKSTGGQLLTMDYLPKESAEALYRLAQQQEENGIAARRQMQIEHARAGAANVVLNAPAAAAAPQQPAATPADLHARLKALKAMLDDGLITPAEFDQRKKEILSQV